MNSIERGSQGHYIHLNFSKAFDSVDNSKLNKIKIKGISEPIKITFGLPQGSHTGPLSIYYSLMT